MNHHKYFCPDCLISNKSGGKHCTGRMLHLGDRPRVPKVTASKTHWKKFYSTFFWQSTEPRIIRNMKKLGFDTSIQEVELEKELEKELEVKEFSRDLISLDNEQSKKLKEILYPLYAVNREINQIHEYSLLAGDEVYITWDLNMQNKIPSEYSKDFKVQKVRVATDKENNHNFIGFYDNTDDGKVFRSFKHFILFEDKLNAEFYQNVYLSQLVHADIYHYQDRLEKILKGNYARRTNPEYFL